MQNTFDAVIIGAGVAGLAAAYHICSEKLKVCVFEKQSDFCQGGSGNSQALLNPFLTLIDSPSVNFMNDAYRESVSFFESKEEQIGFNQSGVIHIPVQSKYQKLIDKSEGEFFRALSVSDAKIISGIDLSSSVLLYPQSGFLSPRKLAECYISESEGNLSLFCGEEANILSYSKENIIVASSRRKISTKIVILASAYEASKETRASHLRLEQVRGEICFLPQTNESSKLKIPVAFNGYLMPAIDGVHMLGSTYDHGEFNPDTQVEKQMHLGDRLTKALPNLFKENPIKEKLQGRVSFRTSTHDRLPYIGPLADEGIYTSLGHGSRGMQTSFYAGQLLARQILSKMPIPEAVLPSRLAK